MSDGVGGAGGAGNAGNAGGSCGANGSSGANGANGTNGANGASGTNGVGGSCAASSEASASVDGAMGEVSNAEVSAAADSVTGKEDGYDGTSQASKDAKDAKDAKEAEVAGICVGTETECAKQFADQAKAKADAMTDEEAIKALDGSFLHDPTSLTPAQVKGLEALSRAPTTSVNAKSEIDSFLADHYRGIDSLYLNNEMGRPGGVYPHSIQF